MTSRQQERVEWIDLAKACCIVLVVMLHVQAYSGVIDWQTAQPIHQLWLLIGDIFTPIRMPLFFLVSGVVAAP